MKFFSFRILIVSLCLALAGWSSSLDSLRETGRSIKNVRADFVQSKHMKILSRPVVSRGRLVYSGPDSLRWEYFSPVPSVLLMDEGKVARYVKSGKEYVRDSGASLQAMQIVLNEITRWFSGKFDSNPDFAVKHSPGPPAEINLVPQKESMSKLISRIRIVFAAAAGEIKSVTVFEDAENYTLIEFSGTLVNKPVDRKIFSSVE